MSGAEKPSTALSRKAWRGNGVMDSSLRSAGVRALVWMSGLRLTPTEFHSPVKVRNSATRGSSLVSNSDGSSISTSSVAAT